MEYYTSYSNGEVGDAAKNYVKTVSDNITLTVHDTGKVIAVGTDAKTVTLPASQAGLRFTFVNIGDNGNNLIKVAPIATEGITGTVTLASSVVVMDGTVNKSIINTKATTKTGDSLTIIGTGLAGAKAWIIVSSTGIWAIEA